MLEYDPRTPIQPGRTFAADVLLRRPAGGHRNIDFDTMEVICTASRRDWIKTRALWFSFLNQGFLRAGVADSDTHTFALDQTGYPRNLVQGPHTVAGFDAVAFNADVRAGRTVGTNGPVLGVRLDSGQRPSLEPVSLGGGAPAVSVIVDVAAAPWIPVTEVRFVVNGRVVKIVPLAPALGDTSDVGGPDHHMQLTVPLAELLQGRGTDAWLVVEAGLPIPATADLDDDGVPDTMDTNGDGVIDRADIPADEDDEELRFPNPGRPPAGDPRFALQVIAPGTWPYAFTNPFLLDLDGGGWTAPGL
jgi:hypothetical protein